MFYTAIVTMLRILLLTLCCSCVLTQGATNDEEKMDVFRLPNNTEPISYDLRITPFLDPKTNNFSFAGEVFINIRVISPTEELTLNAYGLKIEKIEVTDISSSKEVSVLSNKIVDKNQQLKIQLDKPGLIADREYKVQISYSGELRDDMTGFYKSSYFDKESNSIKWLAVTQFEPTYARMAFPCYDEPAYKTPFTITITRRGNQMSLSNKPLYKFYQLPSPDLPYYIRDEFPATEPIPTYLVAFAVTEFVNTTGNQKIFVYTHKDYADQVKYIEGKANTLLNMMEIYTSIPYPVSKLDLLAVPDFSAGAMENWGLNTYKEKYLLVSEKSSEKDKETVLTTVQHEVAHQWFGDLVTCSWWNHVWLNEAFATLFEYFAVNVMEPDWRVGDIFIIEQHQEALSYDHRPKHPITASVNSPDEIEDIFDTITYNKGASVLRMLSHTLNDEIFRTALSLYLKNNMYKSVEPRDLWNSFDNVLFEKEYQLGILGNTITVEEFMNSWTNQVGYPVIHVDTNTHKNSLIITQKLFQVDEPKLNSKTLWHIGLTYTTKNTRNFNKLQPSIWMNNTENKIVVTLTEDPQWVIFNLQSTGFYRVNYDLKNWELLIDEMKKNSKYIHVLNRAQLIDDSFNLARAGELSYSVPLTLISYLENEDDFIPWYSVENSMSYLVERLRKCSHTGPQVKNFTKQYAEIVYQKVSSLYAKNDTRHLTKTSIEKFSNWACQLEVSACVNSSLNYFNAWWKNSTEIPPDVKKTVLCMGVKNGTEETWNRVFNLFLNTSSTSERQAALLALACSTNGTVLTKYLNILLKKDCPIHPQDYKIMFSSLASTPVGINVTTDFLQKKFNESLDKMWKSEEMIIEIYSTLASKVATSKEIDELNVIRNFTYLSPKLKKSFDESFKEVELNSAYFERSHPLLHEWFNPPKEPQTSSANSNSFSFINIIVLLLISVIPLFNNNDN